MLYDIIDGINEFMNKPRSWGEMFIDWVIMLFVFHAMFFLLLLLTWKNRKSCKGAKFICSFNDAFDIKSQFLGITSTIIMGVFRLYIIMMPVLFILYILNK